MDYDDFWSLCCGIAVLILAISLLLFVILGFKNYREVELEKYKIEMEYKYLNEVK